MNKKSHQKERRSFQKTSTLTGCFTIDSISALTEFFRFDPAAIQRISVNSAKKHKILDLIDQYNVDHIKSPEIHTGDELLKAEVRIEVDSFEAVLLHSPRIVMVLDRVTDPRNLGAIVRSAAFFGVDHIVLAKDHQALLSPASVSTSCGGFARTKLHVVTNLVSALKELKENGYWILGAETQGEDVESVVGRFDKVALILGSEDKGLREGVRKTCDGLVGIRSGREGLMSLNVSVASAILLERFTSAFMD